MLFGQLDVRIKLVFLRRFPREAELGGERAAGPGHWVKQIAIAGATARADWLLICGGRNRSNHGSSG